ncbi:hypothetical protein GCM10007036_17480 [Alsobacter metallidurans]|uniref:Hemin uptake protein HemP n=2 Tax=Alsobacter metallidurans TaxID=340221 RepID=A0A917I5G1_9HYPH|nr:hypothetical protein GCM10007036_17480 [Alsobacter metallidurans]
MIDAPSDGSAKNPSADQNQIMRELDAASLLGDARQIVIVHRGERYSLRITAKDKLILTK